MEHPSETGVIYEFVDHAYERSAAANPPIPAMPGAKRVRVLVVAKGNHPNMAVTLKKVDGGGNAVAGNVRTMGGDRGAEPFSHEHGSNQFHQRDTAWMR